MSDGTDDGYNPFSDQLLGAPSIDSFLAQPQFDLPNVYEYDYGTPSSLYDPNWAQGLAGGSDSQLPSWLRNALNQLTSGRGLSALLGAGLGLANRAGPSGGGSRQGYAGPMQLNRQIVRGPNGPIAQYNPVRAATGGPLYAQGGPVQLEHGGFVMTKKAVDGAGGPQGIAQLAPGAQMFRGPGTGTSDSMPAQINGPNGKTPALVSNGEAYLPKQAVQNAGGTRQMMALMKNLENRRG